MSQSYCATKPLFNFDVGLSSPENGQTVRPRPRPRRSILAGIVAILAAVFLSGCGRGAEVPQPKPISKAEAELRTIAPLTRSISLDKAGEIANVEFELPPPGPNSVPSLMLGFRTESPDADSEISLSSKVLRSDLGAKVRLLRVDQGAVTVVPLSRVTSNLGEWTTVPLDGTVPGVTITSVDTLLLLETGLLNPDLSQTQYQFAVAEKIQPGHYHLTIELLQDHPNLEGQGAELLIAYFKHGK